MTEYCFICCKRSFCASTPKKRKVKFKRHRLGVMHNKGEII